MSDLTLEQKLRSAHVKRWHIVNTHRSQTVAEHSFLVQLLAIDISRRIEHSNDRAGPINIEKDYQIMRWAMWHDLPEVVGGDIPTPTKATLKQLTGFDVDERLELAVSSEYARIKEETFPTVKDIVKLADLVEAVKFLSEEGSGKHAKEVLSGLIEQMNNHYNDCKRRHPSFKWGEIQTILV